MRYLFFILLLTPLKAFSCVNDIEIKAEATYIASVDLIELTLQAPLTSKNFRLRNAFLKIGVNGIPMHKGFEIDDLANYKIRGTKEFLKGAQVSFSYTAVDSLCARNEKIDLDKIINECHECANET